MSITSPPDAPHLSEPTLFLFGAREEGALLKQLHEVRAGAPSLTEAATWQRARVAAGGSLRAACLAASPQELDKRLTRLEKYVRQGRVPLFDGRNGLVMARAGSAPRVGFLFPGQGAPLNLGGGQYRARFPFVEQLYGSVTLPDQSDSPATSVAQPAIVLACLVGLRVLDHFGVEASVGVGHSLGELTALHWAGALDAAALLRVATMRGRVMEEAGSPSGTMAQLAADRATIKALIAESPVTAACHNAPQQSVIAGEGSAVAAVVAAAQARGIRAVPLAVSHAFHSPLVAAAVPPFQHHLARETLTPLVRRVLSTVTGKALAPTEELATLLCRQIVQPVRYQEAVTRAAKEVELFIEVGPGRTLSQLNGSFLEIPTIPLDAGGGSLHGLLLALGAIFCLGGPLPPAIA